MTIRILSAVSLLSILAGGCATRMSQHAIESQTFEWSNKPQVSAEQQKLLRLYNKRDRAAADSSERELLHQELQGIVRALGSETVRPAVAGELILSQVGESELAAIYNPSDDNVAFTVAVRGDEEWAGSFKASIGRLTYLPPKGTLIVPALYWTTPRMARRE